MQVMIDQVTMGIHKAMLKWKPSSLEFIVVENEPDEIKQCLWVEQGGEQLAYKRVKELWTLGTILDRRGRTSTSVQARIHIASRHYFRKHEIWSKPGNERMEITRWVEVFHGCMFHGSKSWYVDASILHDIRKTELQFLRKVL